MEVLWLYGRCRPEPQLAAAQGYLSFSLPALAAGFLAPVVGLTRTADFYGAAVILLAISSLIVTLLRRRCT
jgi:hypothetical protein